MTLGHTFKKARKLAAIVAKHAACDKDVVGSNPAGLFSLVIIPLYYLYKVTKYMISCVA